MTPKNTDLLLEVAKHENIDESEIMKAARLKVVAELKKESTKSKRPIRTKTTGFLGEGSSEVFVFSDTDLIEYERHDPMDAAPLHRTPMKGTAE